MKTRPGDIATSDSEVQGASAMLQAPRWHGFKVCPDPDRPGKLKKVPVNLNGTHIDATHFANWSTYEAALAAREAGKFEYLGFALGPDGTGNHWQGIDLDDIEANGLQELANSLPGYVEYSPMAKAFIQLATVNHFPSLNTAALKPIVKSVPSPSPGT
jgi:hypothetical protein